MGVEAYPESWDEVETAKAEGKSTIALKAGEKVRLKFVNGPLAYREMWLEMKDKDGKTVKKRFTIPFGSQVPGYKFKAQWIAEVAVLDGPAAGSRKFWKFGTQISGQLQDVAKEWGSTKEPVLAVSRAGAGLDTEYTVTASKPDGRTFEPTLDLRAEIRFSSAEELQALPSPSSVPSGDETLGGGKMTKDQYDLISSLAEKSGVTHEWVIKTIERKFDKNDLEALTTKEASALIDVLKALGK